MTGVSPDDQAGRSAARTPYVAHQAGVDPRAGRSNARVLHGILEPLGYAVLEAERAKVPAKALGDRAIDLVIADFFLASAFASGDGSTWGIQEIRKRQPNIRILALSGTWRRTAEPAAEAALRIGADLVLGKPIVAAELTEAVVALIGGPLHIA